MTFEHRETAQLTTLRHARSSSWRTGETFTAHVSSRLQRTLCLAHAVWNVIRGPIQGRGTNASILLLCHHHHDLCGSEAALRLLHLRDRDIEARSAQLVHQSVASFVFASSDCLSLIHISLGMP